MDGWVGRVAGRAEQALETFMSESERKRERERERESVFQPYKFNGLYLSVTIGPGGCCNSFTACKLCMHKITICCR